MPYTTPMILLLLNVAAPQPVDIKTDRQLQILAAASPALRHRKLLVEASLRLGTDHFILDGLRVDAKMLRRMAKRRVKEPLLRVAREQMRRPVDVEDLIYLLDDLLLARRQGLALRSVWIPASRARGSGVFVHPDDVFFNRPRVYGVNANTIRIDRPSRPRVLSPAKDGEVLGPRWCARYRNPSGRKAKLKALRLARPTSDMATRVASLMSQFKKQGATAMLYSTLRDPRRGYLMWGSFLLAQQQDEPGVNDAITRLDQRRSDWQLQIPIVWKHTDGWKATVEAAQAMADAYQVAYATEAGAHGSNHYKGVAADLNVFGLPSKVTLLAPDGARQSFDLSAPDQSRDLNLTPELIDWVEQHFGLRKLVADYPHWDDSKAPDHPPATDPSVDAG